MSWHTKPHLLFNEKALTQNTTYTGQWIKVAGAEGFNFWAYMTASGAPDVTISVDVSLFEPAMVDGSAATTHDRDSTDRNNYRTLEVKANETNKAAWQHYDTPNEMQYPIVWVRGRVVENNVAAATTFTLAMAVNVARP